MDINTDYFLTKEQRIKILNQRGMVIWFSGLPCSGKTTMADALEKILYIQGFKTAILDGDNLRAGLCADLDFSEDGRSENLRRAAEVAKLMMDLGIIVLSAFVTPFERNREDIRRIIGNEKLVTVFVDCPLAVCGERDVKGMYRRARSGAIREFTGIGSPFEIPLNADIVLKTAEHSKEELADQVLEFIIPKIMVAR